PLSSTRPKFGSRPAATRGSTYSSDAPSSSNITIRGVEVDGGVASGSPRARRGEGGVAGGGPPAPDGRPPAGAAGRDRQRQRADDGDGQQGGADPAASTAERVVRDRDPEQHDR